MATVFNGVQIDVLTRGDGIDHRVSVRAASVGNVDLTADLNASVLDGVTLAVGDRILVKDQTEVNSELEITAVADVADSLNGTYFLAAEPGTSSVAGVKYYFWYKTDAAAADPMIAGRTGVQITVATGATAAAVATATFSAVSAVSGFGSTTNPSAGVVRVITAKASEYPADGDTGFTFAAPAVAGSGAIQHGLYTIASGAGASYRSDDLIIGDDSRFVFCMCEEGAVNAKSSWTQVYLNGIVDRDLQLWVQDSLFNYSANDMFYADSDSTMATISSANNSILVTNGSGVPSWETALPSGTTISGPFTTSNDVVNKEYVDSVAAGLDPKESVRVRTLGPTAPFNLGSNNIGGTYSAVGGTSASGAFTGVDLTDPTLFDLGGLASALAIGDRVLIMNQSDATQNGIYVVTTAGATGALERAPDQDGSPTAEVSGGNFTFVEAGSNFEGSGWVVVHDGVLTLNTDDMVWSQFSTSSSYNAGDGITINNTGHIISVDLKANGGLVIESGEIAVDLGASSITGILAPADGGTGSNLTVAEYDILVGDGSGNLTNYATSARKVLRTDASGVVSWGNDIHVENILDQNDNEQLIFNTTASAVNEFSMTNAATGTAPILAVSGDDVDINMQFQAKGTGLYDFMSTATAPSTLKMYESTTDGSNFFTIAAGNLTESTNYVWPVADAAASGYALVSDASGVLSWSNVAITGRQVISVISAQVNANTTNLTAVGYFDWNNAEFTGVTSVKLFYEAVVTASGKTLTVEVFNETTGLSIQTDAQTADGFYSFAFTAPTADARLSIRVSKSAPGGLSPSVFGVNIVFNPAS